MRTNLNWTAGKETKFKEFSIYLMISKGFNFNVAQVSETTSTIIGFQLSIFVSIFVCLRSRLSKSQKFCQKQPIVGYRTSFDRFPFEGGRMLLNLRRIYFIEWIYISVVFLWIRYGFLCCCSRYALVRTPAHAHAVWPIVSISLFLLLDYYDYYYIKFSNQLEQYWVRVCLSACVRAASGREGRRHPTHSNRPSSFCDKNSNS